ncbi:meckelin-like [Asterias rubens]|uniref:meckelin-like n=1 Tax=Asterias rubens TaxID=7604 RepID=UPI0014553BEE|nr:meckelin-like [Asterias rubens]
MAARGSLSLFSWIRFVFLSCCCFKQIDGVTYSIQYETPTTCGASQYYDIAGLVCRDCDSVSQTQSSDGLSCSCKSTYKTSSVEGGPSLTCEACPAGQVSTLDGWNCIYCDTLVQSQCEACPSGLIGAEYSITGVLQSNKTCVQCDAFSLPNADRTQCERCLRYLGTSDTCLCSSPNTLFNDLCLLSTELKQPREDTYRVTFEVLDSPLVSTFFSENLLGAEAACNIYQNLLACQLLGNLCVLLNYYPNSQSDACFFFEEIRFGLSPILADNIDWAMTMPWLKYSIDTADRILTETAIPTKFSADPLSTDSKLKLFVAQYGANGDYRGLVSVNGGVIQLCKDTVSEMDAAYTFAMTYTTSCKLTAQDLWNNYETTFYDMYLQYTNDAGEEALYAIPVLLDNYQDDEAFLNRRSANTNWQLTRRFFLVDNISGKESTTAPAKVVRYASSIEILVTMQQLDGETREGKIHPPLLKITYTELAYENNYDDNTEVTVDFRVTYEMNRDYGEYALSTSLGILSGVGIVWGLVRSNAWRRRAGLIYIDVKTMFKFVFFTFAALGNVFFIVLFSATLYWLTFFKLQGLVYLVLPTKRQEESFIWYLCFAFAFKGLEVLHLLVYQCLSDIFLIDWERSRGRVVQSNDAGGAKGNVAPVSIWRTYFVANEWNELQEMRRSNIFFQMAAMLFFLEVVGFKNLATTDPRSDVYINPDVYYGGYSRVLRFAVAAGIYLLLSLLQWVFFSFIYERFVEDSMRNFVDLCSMANVSVFVLSDSNYGYYIHGRSVHGFADTDMKEMRDQLKREEDNLCGQRGLLPNSEQQTFEMLLPQKFREQYNTIIQPLDSAAARIDGSRGRPDSGRNAQADKMIQAYQTMNRFLAAFLDHGIRDIDYVVKDKLLLEQIFDIEFYDPIDKGFFYNDGGHSFDNSLFYGHESTLQIFELLLFCLVDLMFTNYVLAAIITYLGSILMMKIRAGVGRANLAKKTLVDERFLI